MIAPKKTDLLWELPLPPQINRQAKALKTQRVVLSVEISDVQVASDRKHVTSKYHDGGFRKSISRTLEILEKSYGLHGPRPFCIFKNERITSDEATSLFKSEHSKKMADVRIVLSEADIPADELNVDSKAMFIVVGGSPASYTQSSQQSRNFRLSIPAAYSHLFVADYFYELYFANCAYPVNNFISKSDTALEDFYKRKNQFTTNNALSLPDSFGIDKSGIDYTCMFNANRKTTSLFDLRAVQGGVTTWDRLILDPNSGLCPTKEQTLSAIRKWPKVGGSLKMSKISARYDDLPSGVHLLMVQKRATSVRQSEMNHLRVRGLLGDGMTREANLSKAAVFRPAVREDTELNWAIDSNFVQVFRIWKP